MSLITLFDTGAIALIGRDPRGLAEEYSIDTQENCALLAAETQAMQAMVQLRAIRLPPTRSRQVAIDLIPALATLCRTSAAVDMLLRVARDWVDIMGDVRAYASEVAGLRDQGAICDEVRLRLPMAFNAQAVFDVYDASTLSVTLEVTRRQPVVIGLHMIDTDDGERTPVRTPELAA
jgi:hypothetical protein